LLDVCSESFAVLLLYWCLEWRTRCLVRNRMGARCRAYALGQCLAKLCSGPTSNLLDDVLRQMHIVDGLGVGVVNRTLAVDRI
jgi:hypothetical protein